MVISTHYVLFILIATLAVISSYAYQSLNPSIILPIKQLEVRSLFSSFTKRFPLKPRDFHLYTTIASNNIENKKTFDFSIVEAYISATVSQYTLICLGLLPSIQRFVLPRLANLPSSSKIIPGMIALLFFGLSLRARLFSPLDTSRPKASLEDQVFKQRLRPKLQPPPFVFPVVWSTISLLRTISATMIYQTTGTLLSWPIYMFMLHLCIGDTWNTINNVENRLGTSILGVLVVWLSLYFTVQAYAATNVLAAKVLLPSLVWISVATCLIISIWRLNYEKFNQPSLLPSKEEGPPSKLRPGYLTLALILLAKNIKQFPPLK